MANISEKILIIVGEIKGEVKGINNRLDRMNGTIQSHDNRINKNESAIDQQKSKSALIAGLVGFVVSAVGLVIAWFKIK